MVQHEKQLARPIWWQHDRVLMRRKVFAIAPVFQIFDMQGGSLLYCQQKLFKLKEDIRIYSDETKQHEILTIKARNIIDFSACYDVIDAQSQQKVGALRRKGWSSIIRDEWEVLDVNDGVIGKVQEDGLWWLRRLITALVPHKFSLNICGHKVGEVRQFFNPFIFKAEMDLTADTNRLFDRRLALATGILLMAIEGRQKS